MYYFNCPKSLASVLVKMKNRDLTSRTRGVFIKKILVYDNVVKIHVSRAPSLCSRNVPNMVY